MDFLKSLVLDEEIENPDESGADSTTRSNSDDEEEAAENGGLWSLGTLIQTITTRSESVLETYRRDLQEFGTGLKKETDMFREAASKAVKDLPASMMKSTAEIISHGRESLLLSDFEGHTRHSFENNRRYSRLRAIQSDVRTFREEPEDVEEFGKWKMGFALIDRGGEIAGLIGEKGVLEGVHKEVVPSEVDNETFWFRYFYRVHKLQQQESLRANLVRRAISIDDEEELSWDVDDDDDDDGHEEDENVGESSVVKEKGDDLEKKAKGDGFVKKKDLTDGDANGVDKKGDMLVESVSVSGGDVGENKSNVESASKKIDVELRPRDEPEVIVKVEENSDVKKNEDKLVKLEDNSEVKKDEKVEKSEEKESLKGEGDEGGLGKETGVAAKSSQQSKVEEEELEWDVDSNDEKKATTSSVEKSKQADLLKRLNTAEDDEDLSWDIEDDD